MVEGILRGFSQSHLIPLRMLSVDAVVKKLLGFRVDFENCKALKFLKALDVCGTVLVEASLQHQMNIRGSTSGWVNYSGDFPFFTGMQTSHFLVTRFLQGIFGDFLLLGHCCM